MSYKLKEILHETVYEMLEASFSSSNIAELTDKHKSKVYLSQSDIK